MSWDVVIATYGRLRSIAVCWPLRAADLGGRGAPAHSPGYFDAGRWLPGLPVPTAEDAPRSDGGDDGKEATALPAPRTISSRIILTPRISGIRSCTAPASWRRGK